MNLNTEQEAALQALTDRHNTSSGGQLTRDEYMTLVMMNLINDEVKAAIDRAVSRLGAAAAVLPYEQRLALIAQVEAAMPAQ